MTTNRSQQKTDDLILKDFQAGIGTSPETGFEDMRSVNISDSPGSVSLNFAMANIAPPPTVTALAYTVVAGTDVFTVASTAGWYNGMAITLNTVVTSTGIVTGRVYWVGDLSGNTFKLYSNPSLGAGQVVDVTGSNGSGTITSYSMSKPIDKTVFYSANLPRVFILDEDGRAWMYGYVTAGVISSGLIYLGNDTLDAPTATGKAIKVFRNNLIVFRNSTADLLVLGYLSTSGGDFDNPATGWVYNWGSAAVNFTSNMVRPTIVASNGFLYYPQLAGSGGGLGVIYNDNNPLTAPDYDVSALDLPIEDPEATAIGQIGKFLLVAGQREKIYPWDKSSPTFEYPLIVPSLPIKKIVTTGNRAYIFAGTKGRIYVTDGLNIEVFKRLPFQITANQDPIITWDDAQIWRNYLYFSFSANDNAANTLPSVGGVWGINLETGALTLTHKLSYGGYGGNRTLIIPNVVNPTGQGVFAAWASGNSPLNSLYGVDVEGPTYVTAYAAFFITPLFEVGTSLATHEYTQIEIVLEKPLSSGQGVQVSYRPERATAFAQAATFDFATHGAMQFLNLSARFPDLVSLQLKVALTGSATTPVIKTIRLR